MKEFTTRGGNPSHAGIGEHAEWIANFANCKRSVVNCAFRPDCDSALFSAADLCYVPARPLENRTAMRCVPLARLDFVLSCIRILLDLQTLTRNPRSE
jgi:hypothetical protein